MALLTQNSTRGTRAGRRRRAAEILAVARIWILSIFIELIPFTDAIRPTISAAALLLRLQ